MKQCIITRIGVSESGDADVFFHGSMIDKFIRKQMWGAQAQPTREVTLGDASSSASVRRSR